MPTHFECSVIPIAQSRHAWQTPCREKAGQTPRRGPFQGLESSTDLGWKTQHPWRQELFCVWSPKQHILAILLQQSTWWERRYSRFIWHQRRQRHLRAMSEVIQEHRHTSCVLSLHPINCVRHAHTQFLSMKSLNPVLSLGVGGCPAWKEAKARWWGMFS